MSGAWKAVRCLGEDLKDLQMMSGAFEDVRDLSKVSGTFQRPSDGVGCFWGYLFCCHAVFYHAAGCNKFTLLEYSFYGIYSGSQNCCNGVIIGLVADVCFCLVMMWKGNSSGFPSHEVRHCTITIREVLEKNM